MNNLVPGESITITIDPETMANMPNEVTLTNLIITTIHDML